MNFICNENPFFVKKPSDCTYVIKKDCSGKRGPKGLEVENRTGEANAQMNLSKNFFQNVQRFRFFESVEVNGVVVE
jgi:hypothetical protein